MTVLSPAAVADLARAAGLPEQHVPMAVAVAKLESGYDTDAVGDKNRPSAGCSSVGLWQINSCPKWPRGGAESLHDPATNAKQMVTISKGGTDWSPWSTRGPAIVLARTIDVGDRKAGAGSSSSPAPTAPAPTQAAGQPFDLTSGSTWLRVAGFMAGVSLAVAGVALFIGDQSNVADIAGMAGKLKGVAS